MAWRYEAFSSSLVGCKILSTGEHDPVSKMNKVSEVVEDPLPNPSYTSVWPLEASYNLAAWRNWFGSYWILSVYISVVYLCAIFLGQILMRNKPPFQLRRFLIGWNLLLAVFSIFGALRTAPELFHILKQDNGFHLSVCRRDHHNLATAFWGVLFTLSKAVELGDTLFIVLRKQPLIFLHWYHHITVLGYTWFTYESYDATSRWFMVMNYTVHSLMYTYYGLKSLRISVPKLVSMVITFLQLSQMVIGVTVNLYSLYAKSQGVECLVQTKHIHLALIMYASYFILFANFFFRAYFDKRNKKVK